MDVSNIMNYKWIYTLISLSHIHIHTGPLGVLTPVVIPMSATSLLIIFQEPLLPNGDIISYSIFLLVYYNNM